jgi:hypothetical protein
MLKLVSDAIDRHSKRLTLNQVLNVLTRIWVDYSFNSKLIKDDSGNESIELRKKRIVIDNHFRGEFDVIKGRFLTQIFVNEDIFKQNNMIDFYNDLYSSVHELIKSHDDKNYSDFLISKEKIDDLLFELRLL